MNKEELGCRYHEVSAIHNCMHLLKHDKDALFRVLNKIKTAIYEQEAKVAADNLLKRVKK